jgi:hypothetical protein
MLLTNLDPGDQNRISRHLWNTDQLCSTSNGTFAGMLIFFWVGLGVYVLGVPIGGLIAWYVIIGMSRWRARRNLLAKTKEDNADAEKVFGELGLSPTSADKGTKLPTSPESPDNLAEEEKKEKNRILSIARELKNNTTSLLVEGRLLENEPVVVGIEAHSGTIRVFGSLYHRYRPRRFYWEIFVVVRKLLIVICYAYLQQQPVVAVVCSSFVILWALVMQLYFQPYRKATSNILEALLLLFQYIMLILGLMFYASQQGDGIPIVGTSTGVTTTVVVFITIGIIVGVVFLVLESLYEFRRTLYVPIRERMKEQAFMNRAEHAMKVLRKRNKGQDLVLDEHGEEIDNVDHREEGLQDDIIVGEDDMEGIVPGPVRSPDLLNEPATAKYDYAAQNDDELTLKKGDKLTILEKKEDGWWYAKMDGTDKEGLVPSNYMEQ